MIADLRGFALYGLIAHTPSTTPDAPEATSTDVGAPMAAGTARHFDFDREPTPRERPAQRTFSFADLLLARAATNPDEAP